MYKYIQTFAIGGLQNIGYIGKSDNLIVLSMQGRGLFNCLAGEKIFRDSNGWQADFDETNNSVKWFDGEIIKTYGLFGGENLTTNLPDRWRLEISEPEPDDPPFEKYMIQNINLIDPFGIKTFITKDGPCEFRAFGFSETGNSFVVGSSCELVIWSKVDSVTDI
jgi:hypothetical protein